jgi:hypothetical protein
MCHRMGYNHSYIDAHYIFGAFREVLKGKTTLLDEGTYGYLIKYYFIVDNHSVTIRTIGLRWRRRGLFNPNDQVQIIQYYLPLWAIGVNRRRRITSGVEFLTKNTVLLCKVEAFDSVIPPEETCRYAWVTFLPKDKFLLCFASLSNNMLYQQFIFVVKVQKMFKFNQ